MQEFNSNQLEEFEHEINRFGIFRDAEREYMITFEPQDRFAPWFKKEFDYTLFAEGVGADGEVYDLLWCGNDYEVDKNKFIARKKIY